MAAGRPTRRGSLTVFPPELVVRRCRHRPLHGNVVGRLARALKTLPKTVVTTVPLHLPVLVAVALVPVRRRSG